LSNLIATRFDKSQLRFLIKTATPVVLRAHIETPVQTSFGTMTDRPALFLLLEDTHGNIGIGEVWCNFPACGAEHRARLLDTVILPNLLDREFTDPGQCFHALDHHFRRLAIQTGEVGPLAQCLAGIDIALWDLVARRMNVPLYQLFGATDPSIAVYASGINPTGATETFLRCRAQGYNAFKLKIGFGDNVDFANLESICAQLHSDEKLMVDANQAWELDQAITQAGKLADYPIQWLEEPMMADAPAEHWDTLVQVCPIPLAGGENLATANDFSRANQSNWLGIMQPDVCKWGGFSGVLPVARQTIASGKRYCPHFLGGGVGLAASAHLLAATGGDGLLEIDCNPNPLRENLFKLTVQSGAIQLGSEPGLGIDQSELSRLRNSNEFSKGNS